MNMQLLEKLVAMLPDGPKKKEYEAKIQKKKASLSRDGLHDVFEFSPKGHIKIEQIDSEGNVIGVLADQKNLVVKGAEEILLRAFSGDPERILYKVRIPKKNATGDLISPKYHIGLGDPSMTISTPVNGVDQLNVAPNYFWNVVNDQDFDITYSYRPHTVFLKEDTSDQVGKKAFRIYATNPGVGAIPITSEIYSTQTNMFIGLGDGLNYPVSFDDRRLTFSSNWTLTDKLTAAKIGETISFKEKISNFAVSYETSPSGGQIEVRINGVLNTTIETLDQNATVPIVKTMTFDGLDLDTETLVELKFSGANSSVTTPQVVVTGIRFDALSKNSNALIHEFENYTKDFKTPTVFNTTTVPPYYIQLPNFPVVPESLDIEYGKNKLTPVNDMSALSDLTYYVDAKHGKVYFNRTLSGLFVTYSVTGEQYKLVPSSSLTSTSVTRTITKEVPVGVVDGVNGTFTLAKQNIVSGSEVVTVSGVVKARGLDYNINNTTGVITFVAGRIPAAGSNISVDYKSNATARIINLDYSVKSANILEYGVGNSFTLVTDDNAFGKGTFKIDPSNPKQIIISDKNNDGSTVVNYEVFYQSDDAPGVPTGYKRAIIQKPKTGIAYPWYQLDKGTVTFIADFPEHTPNYDVVIREMILCNGPRPEDQIEGYNGFPVDAFSLVRIGETRKEASTGIRVSWTITLLNQDNQPFTGGF